MQHGGEGVQVIGCVDHGEENEQITWMSGNIGPPCTLQASLVSAARLNVSTPARRAEGPGARKPRSPEGIECRERGRLR